MELNANKIALVFAKYILWAAVTAMSFFVLLIGRASLLGAIAGYAGRGFYQTMQVRVFDKVYLIVAGLLALAGMVIMQQYMGNSKGWKNLLLRFSLALGIMLAVLAIFTLVIPIFNVETDISAIARQRLIGV